MLDDSTSNCLRNESSKKQQNSVLSWDFCYHDDEKVRLLAPLHTRKERNSLKKKKAKNIKHFHLKFDKGILKKKKKPG